MNGYSQKPGKTIATLWLVLPSLIIITFCIFGLARLQPNGDPRIFFDRDSTEYQTVLKLEDEFTRNTTIIFVIESKIGTVFNKEILGSIHDLTQSLWGQTHVTRVDSLSNFQRTQSIEDTLETDDLYKAEELSQDVINEIARYSAGESRLINGVLGPDLDVSAVIATLDIERSDQTQVNEVISWAKALKSQFENNNSDIKIHLAGSVAYSDALTDATRIELETKLPWVFGLMIVVLYLILKSGWLVTATLYVVIITNLITLSIAGWAALPITPIIAFVPVSLIAIVLADAIHLNTSYQRALAQSKNRIESIQSAVSENFQPMLVTSITTAIGFLCLNISESPPYKHLGNLVAIGSVFAFVLTVYWMPTWISIFPVKAASPSSRLKISDRLLRFPKISIGIVCLLLAFLAMQLPKNYLDEQMDRFFDDTWEIKKTNTLVNERLGGVHKIEYRVESTSDIPITSQKYLMALSDFSHWASSHPKVAQVVGFDQIIKTIHQQMNNGDDEFYDIPADDQLNSQYFLLYEMSLPYGTNIQDRVNFEKTATRITVVLHSSSSSELIEFRDDANNWIKQNWPMELWTKSISLEAAFSQLNIDNSVSLLQGTFMGFVIIGIVLCFTLKSLKLGVLSLLSNTLPALAGFGIWGIKDGQIGLAVSIVAVITLGVVVDDTIHLLSKYKKLSSKEGYDPVRSAKEALSTTGKALFTTTAVLFICFGVLSFSHFKPNADLGFLSASTLALALIIDVFLLLPAVMLLDKKNKLPQQKQLALS